MKFHIQHRTTYRYEHAANYSIQLLKLTPRREPQQRSAVWRLMAPGRRIEQLDAFGNVTHLVTLEGTHQGMNLLAEGTVEIDEAFDGRLPAEGSIAPLAFAGMTPLTAPTAEIEALAAKIFGGQPLTSESLARLMAEVITRVRYLPGATTVSDTAGAVLQRGAGVCQDQAHVAIAACRAAGIPARYVSGYVNSEEQTHAASHAWVDVWSASEQCWHSCDVTHGVPAAAQLCRLAVGRDYLDAAPVRGVRRGGGREQLEVQVSVAITTQHQ